MISRVLVLRAAEAVIRYRAAEAYSSMRKVTLVVLPGRPKPRPTTPQCAQAQAWGNGKQNQYLGYKGSGKRFPEIHHQARLDDRSWISVFAPVDDRDGKYLRPKELQSEMRFLPSPQSNFPKFPRLSCQVASALLPHLTLTRFPAKTSTTTSTSITTRRCFTTMPLLNGKPNPSFIGAIDQGTTSSRFLIFDTSGEVVATHQLEFKQYYPHPGWHEHDPEELVSSVEQCIDGAVEAFESQGHSREQIKAVGITNQRETTVVWDKTTGNALHNAIVWTDTRSKDLVRRLKRRLGASELIARCGIPLSTYPSVSKLLWLLENIPEVKDAYERGVLAFGTVDTWLTYKLNGATERDVYVSDPSNASRTMFMNLETLKYDEDILDWFRVDDTKVTLPRIVRSSDNKAYGSLASTSLKGVKITGCLGDQSAALVGQKAFTPGLAKNTYGTGCFLLYNVGKKPVISSHGLLTTVAFDFGEDNTMYALEGSIAVAGSSVKFLVDNFGFMESSSKLSALAETVEDNGGCTFVTAFSGLFAPYWIDDARGTIFGITAYTQRGHVARATLEATCFQTKAILDSMEKDSGHALTELAVDGGMCNSDLIMQTQSDLIGIPVNRPGMRETTALGAAIAAGFAIGIWKSFDELKEVNTQGRTIFKPQIAEEEATKRFSRWTKAVEMSKGWTNE